MKIHQLLKKINSANLIEVVDEKYRRLYYGRAKEMSTDEWKFLTSWIVLGINSFLAEIGLNNFETCMQIIVKKS